MKWCTTLSPLTQYPAITPARPFLGWGYLRSLIFQCLHPAEETHWRRLNSAHFASVNHVFHGLQPELSSPDCLATHFPNQFSALSHPIFFFLKSIFSLHTQCYDLLSIPSKWLWFLLHWDKRERARELCSGNSCDFLLLELKLISVLVHPSSLSFRCGILSPLFLASLPSFVPDLIHPLRSSSINHPLFSSYAIISLFNGIFAVTPNYIQYFYLHRRSHPGTWVLMLTWLGASLPFTIKLLQRTLFLASLAFTLQPTVIWLPLYTSWKLFLPSSFMIVLF